MHAPFRFDIVGSFLRPEALKKAREDFAEGKISRAELTAVEDVEIRKLVAKQQAVGLRSSTDGEFRRGWWNLDFMWGLGGAEKALIAEGYPFMGETTKGESVRITGKLTGENHPFVEHFKFLKSITPEGMIPRQTIPAPAQFLFELVRPDARKSVDEVYGGDFERVAEDMAAAYRTVIRDLYDAGCRSLQLDDCTWGSLCDERWQGAIPTLGESFVRVNNAALEGRPEGMTITSHVCRGNFHSTWATSGGYEPVAEMLFGREKVDAFYLEFDTERAGGFEPLRFIRPETKVVLGLVTSKSPVLESRETLLERIEAASKIVPLERLCLSPQCGFASTEEGNKLTEDEQWAKLELVRDVAREVWGE